VPSLNARAPGIVPREGTALRATKPHLEALKPPGSCGEDPPAEAGGVVLRLCTQPGKRVQSCQMCGWPLR